MKSDSKLSLGVFAKRARVAKGFGLREVARKIGISAAYLSRVENDLEAPSEKLISHMAGLYDVPLEELTRRVTKPNISAAAHGRVMQASPELRALYRIGAQLDSDAVEEIIRKVLVDQGVTEREIEKQIASLKSKLPRLANAVRDGLFAEEAVPRFLPKARIAAMAHAIMARNGFTETNYAPPTPVELLVENEPGVVYRIENLKCDKNGNPIVLGLTGWDESGNRQIVLNSVLADSDRKSDEHRFNFTLAHELFHAIEHLPRVPKTPVAPLARMRVFVDGQSLRAGSAAEKAVNQWANAKTAPRPLTTNEDWREWQANTFASYLLMPSWALVAEFRKRVGSEKLVVTSPQREAALQVAGKKEFESRVFDRSLSDLFAVSRQAMAIRLLQLGLLEAISG